jgi:carbon starvation protein
MKIFSPKAAGFLPAVRKLEAQLAAGVPADQLKAMETALFNARLDIVVVAVLLGFVAVITLGCAWEWWRILSGGKKAVLHESPYIALED